MFKVYGSTNSSPSRPPSIIADAAVLRSRCFDPGIVAMASGENIRPGRITGVNMQRGLPIDEILLVSDDVYTAKRRISLSHLEFISRMIKTTNVLTAATTCKQNSLVIVLSDLPNAESAIERFRSTHPNIWIIYASDETLPDNTKKNLLKKGADEISSLPRILSALKQEREQVLYCPRCSQPNSLTLIDNNPNMKSLLNLVSFAHEIKINSTPSFSDLILVNIDTYEEDNLDEIAKTIKRKIRCGNAGAVIICYSRKIKGEDGDQLVDPRTADRFYPFEETATDNLILNTILKGIIFKGPAQAVEEFDRDKRTPIFTYPPPSGYKGWSDVLKAIRDSKPGEEEKENLDFVRRTPTQKRTPPTTNNPTTSSPTEYSEHKGKGKKER